MTQSRLDRVGIKYVAVDKVSPVLKKISQGLESISRRTLAGNELFEKMGDSSVGKLGQMIERMEKIQASMRGINRLGRENSDQEKLQLCADNERCWQGCKSAQIQA
jgi:hypothetical protein